MDRNLKNIRLSSKQMIWLKKVSRTFYISIKLLPNSFRGLIAFCYILCRFLDIIEDNVDMDLNTKKKALNIVKSIIDEVYKPEEYSDFFINLEQKYKFIDSERELLKNNREIFNLYQKFPDLIKGFIKKWVGEMAFGMNLYAFENHSGLNCLKKISDLDRYTYYVAGTVGGLLTDIYSLEINKIKKNSELVKSYGINFGKGLQFVNIIKDSRIDFLENRCYIPEELFDKYKIKISSFFKDDGNKVEESIKIYKTLIEDAKKFLEDALKFISFIPRNHFRLRFASFLPLELAYKTLNSIEEDISAFIGSKKSFKIPRKEVRKSIIKSIKKSFLYKN